MHYITVDGFAGAGGASKGIEIATGRKVDIAINHDREAIDMHQMNHPDTKHYCEDIFSVDPREATEGRPVGLAWFSPDCTHHSKARGGKPVSKKIRGLAWVVLKWANQVKPRVIVVENVEEFQDWGPLDDNDKPRKKDKGKTFTLWVNRLRGAGYDVQWRELVAADYGTPTTRKRLFVIARCDGQPIVWPEPTHSQSPDLFGGKPWRTAAECIDWSIPTPSIFLTREEGNKVGCRRPLAEKTMERIARGVKQYVLDAAEPFIIGIDNKSSKSGNAWSINQPVNTIVTKNRFALVTPFLSKYYSGVVGSKMTDPVSTITAIDHNALIMPFLSKYHGTTANESRCNGLGEPIKTIDTSNRFALVSSFLIKYYGCGTGQSVNSPLHTITTKESFGLVTVAGCQYQIADIGLRMLTPDELKKAQGFPADYIMTGSKACQIRKIGNSVCPQVAAAIVRANTKSFLCMAA